MLLPDNVFCYGRAGLFSYPATTPKSGRRYGSQKQSPASACRGKSIPGGRLITREIHQPSVASVLALIQ